MEADRFQRSAQTFGIKLKSNLQGFGGGREKYHAHATQISDVCVCLSLSLTPWLTCGGGKKRINFTPLAPRDAASVYSSSLAGLAGIMKLVISGRGRNANFLPMLIFTARLHA
jgi:hypothetical protein